MRPGGGSGTGAAVGLAMTLLLALPAGLLHASASSLAAQADQGLSVVGPSGEGRTLRVSFSRGYAAVPAGDLAPLGWTAERAGEAWRLRHHTGPDLRFRPGSPFFRWGEDLLQLVSEPYVMADELYVPLQLLLDFLPARLPDAYSAGDAGQDLRVASPDHWDRPATARGPPADEPQPASPPPARVVFIDAGHGGEDPGAVGPGGTREKDVALAIARALERELRGVPGLEVHMTRDSDVLVPLWKRGEEATRVKGDRPGIFISIHANALPSRRATRGFETYFLSEARTDHERRVAANENASLALEATEERGGPADPGLAFILKELRNLDTQHWSALLAELVQERMAPVHPGPDRGVKQGPFAVITNALMPAVLVETGFITNPGEERVLARTSFQRDIARSLAEAVVEFFQRYPPGRADPGFGGEAPGP